jgi:hypothetical protein
MDDDKKSEALAALAPFSICYRERKFRIGSPDPWYIHQPGIEVKCRSILRSPCGNGASPLGAVSEYWDEITNLKPGEYVVIGAMAEIRRAVEWNGFMWADVRETEAVQ